MKCCIVDFVFGFRRIERINILAKYKIIWCSSYIPQLERRNGRGYLLKSLKPFTLFYFDNMFTSVQFGFICTIRWMLKLSIENMILKFVLIGEFRYIFVPTSSDELVIKRIIAIIETAKVRKKSNCTIKTWPV